MKLLILIIPLILVYNTTVISQETDTIYYNKNWKETTSIDFKFYRIYFRFGDLVKVVDYYKNGKVQMTGSYKSSDFKDKSGLFKYYKKERLTQLELHEQSKYPEILASFKEIIGIIPQQPDSLYLVIFFNKDNKFSAAGYRRECCFRYGSWIFSSKNGKYLTLETYKNDLLDGPVEIYYKNQLYHTGYYKNGKMDGVFTYYDIKNKNILLRYNYIDGKKIKTVR